MSVWYEVVYTPGGPSHITTRPAGLSVDWIIVECVCGKELRFDATTGQRCDST